jgi:hypothetical protein
MVSRTSTSSLSRRRLTYNAWAFSQPLEIHGSGYRRQVSPAHFFLRHALSNGPSALPFRGNRRDENRKSHVLGPGQSQHYESDDPSSHASSQSF